MKGHSLSCCLATFMLFSSYYCAVLVMLVVVVVAFVVMLGLTCPIVYGCSFMVPPFAF